MDKVILNGDKIRLYSELNAQSGSIYYTNSHIKIVGTPQVQNELIVIGEPYNEYSANEIIKLRKNHISASILLADESPLGNYDAPIGSLFISSDVNNPQLWGKYDASELYWGKYILTDNSYNASIDGTFSLSGIYFSSGGKYYQVIGAEPDAYVIYDEPNNTHPFLINSQNSYIVFDDENVGYNIGIGISVPTHKLDVVGDVNIDGLITTSTGITSSNGYIKIGGEITGSNLQLANGRLNFKSGNGSGSIYIDPNSVFNISNPLVSADITSYGELQLYGGVSLMDSQTTTETFLSGYLAYNVNYVNIGVGSIYPSQIYIGDGYEDSVVEINPNTTFLNTIKSPTYASGFGGYGWIISKSTSPSRYTAVFDDLWIRGSMNVYEMVINQIRATNGSLWVSDAAKATSASYNSTNASIYLTFQSGSYIPFVPNDIIRSKRWNFINSGSSVQTRSIWDCVTTVSSINYALGIATISAPSNNGFYCYTASSNGSWVNFTNIISISGSEWVRVGNVSNSSRRGAIYLTSTDLGGPFLDIYDNVSSSYQSIGGLYDTVTDTKLKLRLGQLSGLSVSPFGQLYGYGLYADNVYLRGTISATQGTFSGTVYARDGIFSGSISSSAGQIANWIIEDDNINNDNLYLGQSDFFAEDGDIFIGTVEDQGYINFGNKLIFTNSNLIINGSITASSGNIGGWDVMPAYLYKISPDGSSIYLQPQIFSFQNRDNSSVIQISPQSGIYIYDGYSEILLGFQPDTLAATRSFISISDIIHGEIFSYNYTDGLSVLGAITAKSGYIGGSQGWTINSTNITSSGIEILGGASPAIKIGATSYGSSGIWLGKGSQYSMSLYNDANNYLKWNGSNLQIKTPNFTLSTVGNISASNVVLGGDIRATSGNIGTWNITPSGIVKTSSFSTVSITTNGYDYLNLFDIYNNFTFSAANSGLYTSVVNQYNKLFNNTNWQTKSIHCSASTTENGIGIRISNSAVGSIIHKLYGFKPNTSLTKNVSYTLTTDCTSIELQNSGDFRYTGKLFIQIYTSSGLQDSSKLYSFTNSPVSILNGRDIQERNYNIIWTGSASTQNVYPVLSLYLDPPLGYLDGDLYFTFSGIRVDRFNKITQLSQKGLLIFNDPQQYVQIMASSDSQQSSSAALNFIKTKQLYIDDVSVKQYISNPISVNSGGTGTSASAFTHGKLISYNSSSGKMASSAYSGGITYMFTKYTQSITNTPIITSNEILTSMGMTGDIDYPVISQVYAFIPAYNKSVYTSPDTTYTAQIYSKSGTSKSSAIFDYIKYDLSTTDPENKTMSIALTFRLK